MDSMTEDDRLGFVSRSYKWPDHFNEQGKFVEGQEIVDDKGRKLIALHAINEDWYAKASPDEVRADNNWHDWKSKKETYIYNSRKSYVADISMEMDNGDKWWNERPHEVFIAGGRSQSIPGHPDHPYFKHRRDHEFYYNVPQELIAEATPYKFTPKDRLGGLWKYGQRVVTLMDPADYLSMTTPIPLDKNGVPLEQEGSIKFISDRYKKGYVWGSTPYIEIKDGRPQGAQHEGRHRAWVMMTEYPGQKIPVTIYNMDVEKVDGITTQDFMESGYEDMDPTTRMKNLRRAMDSGQLPAKFDTRVRRS